MARHPEDPFVDNRMSVVALPHNTGPEAVADAQAKLKVMIEDALTVVALVRGGHSSSERVLEVAVARASVKPELRRVVWVPDVTVLSATQNEVYFGGGLLAIIGLADRVAKVLSAEDATIKFFVEKAFAEAEAQST